MKWRETWSRKDVKCGQTKQPGEHENSYSLLEEIHAAFDVTPDLDQVFHGTRSIKLGKQGSRSSLFYSRKCGGFIPVESRLELRHCYQLEINRAVRRYRSQAIRVPHRGRYLVPDFLIEFVDGTFEVLEVKVDARLRDEEQKLKLQFISEFLMANGMAYRVLTEKDLPHFCAEQNVVMLYDRGGRIHASDLQLRHVSELVRSMSPTDRTVGRVREQLRCVGMPIFLLENALFSGWLKCDLNRPICSRSLIEVPA